MRVALGPATPRGVRTPRLVPANVAATLLPIVLAGSVIAACGVAPPASTRSGQQLPSQGVVWVPLDTFDPNVPCAGAELVGLKVSVAPDAVTTGVIVDPADPSTPIDPTTFLLVWPPGYAAGVGAAGAEVIDAKGSVVARDGTVLMRPQVCREGDRLLITSPFPPSS